MLLLEILSMAMWSDWASVAGIAAQYIGGDLALQ